MVVIVLGFLFCANISLFKLVSPPHNIVVIVLDLLLRNLSYYMHDSKIRVLYAKTKNQTNSMTKHKIKMHENQAQCTLAPLGLQSTCCLKMGHVMHVEYFGKTKTKQNIIVPR